MKVLIDVSPLSTAHSVRGVGMYTRFLSEALEKQKDVEVFRSSLSQRPKKIDIIHYPFFDLFFPTLPFLKKAKTVVTIHDVIPLIFPEQYLPGKRGALAFTRQKLALKTVSGVITDSETSKRDIITHLGVPEQKVHVVSLAANPFLLSVSGAVLHTARRRLGLPRRYILYVGDINYNKNIPQLVKALKFLPEDIKLVCVGKNFVPNDIPEWRAIEAQIALSNVAKRVIFKTDILSDDYDSLSALYSGAEAYVQPSLYEGFGLPVLEAMRCKTPVVLTENSSLVEVGGSVAQFTGNLGEDLAAGVSQILALPASARKQWVQKAWEWQETFTWDKTAKETAEVYRKLL